MKLTQRMTRAWDAWRGTLRPENMTSRELAEAVAAYGRQTSSGVNVSPDTAMRCTAVFACVRVLADSLAQSLPDMYRMDGNKRERDTEHNLHALLHDSPNQWQTAFEYWEMLMGHLALRGNAYSWKNRLSTGRLYELIPLHPDKVQVTQNADWSLSYTLYPGESRQRIVGQEQIWHLRGLGTDGYKGLGPIEMAREAVGLALATEKHGSKLFSNGIQTTGVYRHPKTLSPEAHKNLKESLKEKQAGLDNAWAPIILEEGMDFTKVGMTAEDSQFLETRKYQRGEVASIFRVPPHMIGDLERATFSNIEHQSLEFVNRTMMPWFVRIQSSIRKHLLSEAERPTVSARFDAKALLQGDTKSRYEANNIAIQGGWKTRNEARVEEGLNPLPGLDEPLQPLNMATTAAVAASTAA